MLFPLGREFTLTHVAINAHTTWGLLQLKYHQKHWLLSVVHKVYFFCQLEWFLVYVSSGFLFLTLHCLQKYLLLILKLSAFNIEWNFEERKSTCNCPTTVFCCTVFSCFTWPYIHTWKTSFLYLHSEESVCIPDCNRSESSREEKKVPVKEDALTVKKTGNCVSLIVPQQDCQLQDLLKQLRTPAA